MGPLKQWDQIAAISYTLSRSMWSYRYTEGKEVTMFDPNFKEWTYLQGHFLIIHQCINICQY